MPSVNKTHCILVVIDYPIDAIEKGHEKYIQAKDWRPDRNVIQALKKLGHDVHTFGIKNRIRPLIAKIRRLKPDLVFNLVECFMEDRKYEASIAGLFDLLNVRYTGCPPISLTLCKNKSFTKRILAPHKIKFPKSIIFPVGNQKRSLKKLRFPLFVKPLEQEASDGIAQSSFVEDKTACMERVTFIHDHYQTEALVEEYIEGREIYAGILGNQRLSCLPLREMIFTQFPETKPKFATYKAKWDKPFRQKWGIKNTFADSLDAGLMSKISRLSRSAYRALGLKGYGRLDLRITENNEIYVIEVNPNPSLSNDDEIALASKRMGLTYVQLIDKIVKLALQ